MDIKQLHKDFTKEMARIVKSQKETAPIEKVQELLRQHHALLEKEKSKRSLYLFGISVVGIFLGALLAKILFKSLVIVSLLSLASGLLFFIVAFAFQSAFSDVVPVELIFLKKLIKRGWKIELDSPSQLWQKYASKYPFLHKGDTCDELHCVVHGKTDRLVEFIYFDYFYTIELEEDVEKEDSDGEIYYETEYYEESYTQTCLMMKKENDLPLITINSPLKAQKPLKFSNIQLNYQAKIYTADEQTARTFFNPSTQISLSAFYKRFPSATIQIDKCGIFINFGTDLTDVAHNVAFDASLADKMESAYLRRTIENLVNFVCSELMSSFGSSTLIHQEKGVIDD